MPHTNNKNRRVDKEANKSDRQARGKSQGSGKGDFIRKAFGENRGGKGNLRKSKEQRKKGQPRWKNVTSEIEQLETRIAAETPPPGILYYKYKPKTEDGADEKESREERQPANSRHPILETGDRAKIKIRFSDLPVSRCTSNGLFKSKFLKMTEVQRASIPHALSGRDIVCSARTGSGKTLSYLIPVVEALYRARWT